MMRRTPMKRGTKPMARGVPLKAKKQWKPRYKPQSKRPNREFAAICHGERCYLQITGVQCEGPVVPCHSNQQEHGKGMGIKADDWYTVPGCRACHHELDQGRSLSKEGRRHIWNAAFDRWLPVRAKKMGTENEAIQGGLGKEEVPEVGTDLRGDDLPLKA